MKIYVVSGISGSYEDKVEWMVKAFTDPNAAEYFRKECQEFVDKIRELAQDKGWDIIHWLGEIERRQGPDSSLYTNDGWAYYSCAQIELVQD